LNEATEYINPTKTLEYMAAGKPIVSTPIADVVHHFTPVVKVARSHDAFVAAVRSALTRPEPELIARGIGMAKDSSWEAIVGRMGDIIAETIAPRHPAPLYATNGAGTGAAARRAATGSLRETAGSEGLSA
jgi:glycosyltransferase involved in cell wall biosynthesis